MVTDWDVFRNTPEDIWGLPNCFLNNNPLVTEQEEGSTQECRQISKEEVQTRTSSNTGRCERFENHQSQKRTPMLPRMALPCQQPPLTTTSGVDFTSYHFFFSFFSGVDLSIQDGNAVVTIPHGVEFIVYYMLIYIFSHVYILLIPLVDTAVTL